MVVVDYTFKDFFGRLRDMRFCYPSVEIKEKARRFGISSSLFKPFYRWEIQDRKEQCERGLFDPNTLAPDKSAVVSYYAALVCKPIARAIADALHADGRDTRLNRIRMAMKFVQDIPYGIPDFDDATRRFGGVIPPPLIMMFGYGDCDSKAMLFAGILSYLIDYRDIIFLKVPLHVLTAVYHSESLGTSIQFRNRPHYLSETAGTGRYDIGEEGIRYGWYQTEALQWKFDTPPSPLPFGSSHNDRLPPVIADVNKVRHERNTDRQGQDLSNRDKTWTTNEEGKIGRNIGENPKIPEANPSFLSFRIGGGIAYYQGDATKNPEHWTLDEPIPTARVSLGFTLTQSYALDFHLTAGSTEFSSLRHLLGDQGHPGVINRSKDFYPFWEYELGVLLLRFIRLSAGAGTQEFTSLNHATRQQLQYYTTSAGFELQLGTIGFELSATMMFGEDYKRRVLKTTAGVMLYP